MRQAEILSKIKTSGGARMTIEHWQKKRCKIALIFTNSKYNGSEAITLHQAEALRKYAKEITSSAHGVTYHF